jgi:predicted membrane-bound mannosyltransferase
MLVALKKRATLPTFLTFYTLILTVLYSAISYKTPWCLLNFLFGLILLAGIGASALMGAFSNRFAKAFTAIVLLALATQLAIQSYRASYVYAADRRNPYVYAQTVPDLLNLVKKVDAVAQLSPTAYDTIIKVITPDGDYWPLPWYLRQFTRIGWYDSLPADPYAPMIIVSAQLDARLDEKSDKKWIMVGLTELRPQKFLELYVEAELWKKYIATLPRERD